MSNTIGIDVSEWNNRIDWKTVKNAGISFAIIRCGYGRGTKDELYRENVEGCVANDIPFGVYHFSYALDANDAKKEALYVLSLLASYRDKITLPVFYDFEYDTVNYAKGQGVTLGKAAFNAHTLAFADVIRAGGYTPGTYYNLDYLERMVDPAQLKGLPIWYAQFNPTADFTGYDIWQYSNSLTIPGHDCNFDANIMQNLALLHTESEEKTMNEKRYNTIDDVPEWGKETVRKLAQNGLISGTSGKRDSNGYPVDLNLTADMIRLLVINDRAGLYK